VALEEIFVRYLTSHARGRLATVGTDGMPQNKPVGYRFNAELETIDIGGFNLESSAKYRNIAANPQVSFVVDDDAVGEGTSGVRFVEVRGPAEQVSGSPAGQGESQHLIRIRPRRVVSWNVVPGEPAFAAQDLEAGPSAGQTSRPAGPSGAAGRPELEVGGAAASEAAAAAASFADELQAGWDSRDAEVSNRHFAADIAWGSPFGAIVRGYDDLHAIHVRLKSEGRGGLASRFVVEQVLTPAAGIAAVQIRRVALGRDGFPLRADDDDYGGAFSEVALYVLVRRGETWWVAAGQNTPVQLPE
jgi:PPOX class F420-dependent enzyme/OxyR family protein